MLIIFCQSLQHLSGMNLSTNIDLESLLSLLYARVYARLAKETGTHNDLVAVLRSVSTLRLFELPLWEDPTAALSIRATLFLLNTLLEVWGTKST
jgi:hypothetical protein